MTNLAETIDVARFDGAARFTPAIFAPRLCGAILDGYWIDSDRFFFSVSDFDADGRKINLAKIADAAAATVELVLDPAVLASLLVGVGATAITSARYDMPEPDRLVVTIGDNAYHIDLAGPELVETVALDPGVALYSPDRSTAAFLKDNAIWLRDTASGKARQLTPDGERHNGFGTMVESGLSPLKGRKFPMPDGRWSENSEWFATHRIDERELPESGLVQSVPDGGGRPIPHSFKITSATHDLARAEFLAYHLPTGRVVASSERPVEVGIMPPFMYHQAWFVGDSLYYLDWNRFSSEVSLIEMPLDGSGLRTVLTDTGDGGWIDLNPKHTDFPNIRPLPASGELIWYSEEDGYAHLYLHDLATGNRKGRITEGRWMVRELLQVDEARRRITFLASGFEGSEDSSHRRLCLIGFDGGDFRIVLDNAADLFPARSVISPTPDPTLGLPQANPYRSVYALSDSSLRGDRVVLQTGAVDKPTRTLLVDIETGTITELARSNVEALWTAPRPQPFEFLASDGVTKLRGAMYVPSDFDPAKTYPLIDYIYPGPHVNWYVRRFPSWPGLDLQALAELGMVGIVIETRGMPARDRAFHQAGQGELLEPQLGDHAAAVRQLCERHDFLDKDRVGIFGQSGGGYATARAMFDYPETFKVGVSICGNHDNRNYMAHWIDKYGPRPGSPGRESQSNIPSAHKLEGKLLLIHGELDENVHPGHTLSLTAALIAADKEFEHLIVPNAGHMLALERSYVFRKLANFFALHLIGIEPPRNYRLDWTPAGTADAMRVAFESFA